jgi:hypothetical protein
VEYRIGRLSAKGYGCSIDAMDIEKLDSLRAEGDPVADDIVRRFAGSDALGTVMRRLRAGATVDHHAWQDVPRELTEFLTATATPPTWALPERLARVPAFYAEHRADLAGATVLGGILAVSGIPRQARLMLFPRRTSQQRPVAPLGPTVKKLALVDGIAARDVTLPSGALGPMGKKLTLLHGLGANTAQPMSGQIGPTLQKLQLLEPLGCGGTATNPLLGRSVQAIRLQHAIVRDRLRRTGWDTEIDGAPIHQEDMLCTALLLSVVVLDALDRLCVTVTEQQAADYYHAWRVAAAMLGTRGDALPATLDQARELLPLLLPRNFGASPEGAELTHGMLSAYADMTAGTTTTKIAAAARTILGEQLADQAGVPTTEHASLPAARDVCDQVGQALLSAATSPVVAPASAPTHWHPGPLRA